MQEAVAARLNNMLQHGRDYVQESTAQGPIPLWHCRAQHLQESTQLKEQGTCPNKHPVKQRSRLSPHNVFLIMIIKVSAKICVPVKLY